MKQYRHRRSANPSNPFPNPLEPGELAVNTANRQLAVGDANAGSVGVPLPLLAIRYFDARASYAAGDMVVQAGKLYTANAAVPPGAFNGSQWTEFTGGGGTATDPTKVLKAGDTMSGHLFLPTSPAAANAVRRDYVDAADLVLTNAINNKSSLTVSDTPPSTPADGQLWWESDTGMLYVRYNDGVGPAQWVQAVAVPVVDTSTLVAKAGDTMTGLLTLSGDPTAPLHAVTKQYTDARVLDQSAYNGMQINGSFEIGQEKGTAGTTTNGAYVSDGWMVYSNGVVFNAAQDNADPMPGFVGRIFTNATTPKASLAGSEYLMLSHRIEGFRASRLGWGTAGAMPITIAFWSQHNTVGTYSVAINNAGSTRSYATTYTQNVAGTREYKTVTIPGDTAGTWLKDNGVGMAIQFASACGPTLTAPSANTWLAGNYVAAPGQVNNITIAASYLILRGVVVLPGIYAPTAAQSSLIMRPYGQEILTCQRYFYSGTPPMRGIIGGNLLPSRMGCLHPVVMRVAPVVTFPTGAVPIYDGTAAGMWVSFGTNFSTVAVLELDGGSTSVTYNAGRPAAAYQGNGNTVNVDARL